jgi:hypothetical protein
MRAWEPHIYILTNRKEDIAHRSRNRMMTEGKSVTKEKRKRRFAWGHLLSVINHICITFNRVFFSIAALKATTRQMIYKENTNKSSNGAVLVRSAQQSSGVCATVSVDNTVETAKGKK